MVTTKIRAIWRIIFANHYVVISKRGEGIVDSIGAGASTLDDLMILAVELKRTSARLLDMVADKAADEGELRTLEALKKAVEEIDGGN